MGHSSLERLSHALITPPPVRDMPSSTGTRTPLASFASCAASEGTAGLRSPRWKGAAAAGAKLAGAGSFSAGGGGALARCETPAARADRCALSKADSLRRLALAFELTEALSVAGGAFDAAWSLTRADVRRALNGCFALVADVAAGFGMCAAGENDVDDGALGRASAARASAAATKETDMR